MRLTVFSDYALRVLIYVALKGEQKATIGEIADAYNISHNHLMKVVQRLSSLGLLRTIRGKGGGFILAQAPSDIRIGELVEATDGGTTFVECMSEEGECRITAACVLPMMFRRALKQFYAELDLFTLADLIAQPRLLRTLWTNRK